jgi:hypothetical protein
MINTSLLYIEDTRGQQQGNGPPRLASFPMYSLAIAITAELLQLDTVRIVLFVFRRGIVPLFAVCASERNDNAHSGTPPPKGQRHK